MRYSELEKLLASYDYEFYSEPYALNIVGIRKKINTNLFDDTLVVAYKDERDFDYTFSYNITTDPGRHSLLNPKNRKGTAILVEGQYVGTHAIDYHRGNYKALCQRLGPVKVYRDFTLDEKHDISTESIEEGFFGINIHKAGVLSKLVDGWSAGCQVFQESAKFDEFMLLCKMHSKKHGNKFTYTLIRP